MKSIKDLFNNRYVVFIPIPIISLIYWKHIKRYINDKTKTVIIQKVNDKDIQKHIYNSLVNMSANIKNDPNIHSHLIHLINTTIIDNDILKQKILDKLVEIIKSDEIKKATNELLYNTIHTQLENDKTIKLLSSTFNNILYISVARILLTTKNHLMFWK